MKKSVCGVCVCVCVCVCVYASECERGSKTEGKKENKQKDYILN